MSIVGPVERSRVRAVALAAVAVVACVPAAVACAAGASVVADSPAFSLIVAVTAVATVGVCVLVVSHRRGHDLFSPLGLICLFNIATFAIGAVYFYLAPWPGALAPYALTDLAPAARIGGLGLIMLTLGYSLNPLRVVSRVLPTLPSELQVRRVGAFTVAILAVGWASRAYEVATHRYFYSDSAVGGSTGTSWLLSTLAALPLVAAAYCGGRYYVTRRAGGDYGQARWQYYVLVLAETAYNAPRGSRAAILTLLMMIVVLRYYGLGRRPSAIGLVAVGLVAVVVVFPVVFAYRNANTVGGYQQDLRSNLVGSGKSLLDSSATAAIDTGLTATVSRFSGVTSMAAVLHYGRAAAGRRSGETLAWALTAFVPRAIDPNKADPGHYGNEFAQRFAIAAPGGAHTSVSVPHVVELYLNFGLTGVIIGMLMVGSLYRVMGDFMATRRTDTVGLALYAALAWPLINSQEAIIAGSVLGAVKVIAVLSAVLVVAARWRGLGAGVAPLWTRRTRSAA